MPKAAPPVRVPVMLWEPSSVNRASWPLTAGVPFPQGALEPDTPVALHDGETPLPTASRPLARWKDGSVRWLLVDSQVGLAGGERKSLELRAAVQAPPHPRPVEVSVGTHGVLASTGELSLAVRRGGRMPFHELCAGGSSIVAPDAAELSVRLSGLTLVATVDEAAVESSNPLHVVIRCDGAYRTTGGAGESAGIAVTCRIHLWAGCPFLRIYHTVTNRSGRDLQIEDLALVVPTGVSPVRGRLVSAAATDLSLHRARGEEVSLQIDTEDLPETRYSAAILVPHIHAKDRVAEIDGTTERRAAPRCRIAGSTPEALEVPAAAEQFPLAAAAAICGGGRTVALSCRAFSQQAPKRIAASGAALDLRLYHAFDGRPLELWRGTAKTHELHLSVLDGESRDTEEEVRALKRLLVSLEEPVFPTFGSSNWLQDSGALGPLFPYLPEKYPWLEFVFRRIYEQWYQNPGAALRGSTVLDYGDFWNPGRGGQWQNNEMDFGAGLLVYALRTGYPRPWAAIESMVHHMMDVDTHHEAEDPLWVGAQRYHQVRHGAYSPPALCHQWLEGPLYYYFLTGYERAREIALARAQHFCRSVEAGKHRVKSLERVQGWPMVALSTVNECLPDPRYGQACESIMDWLEQWVREDGDLVTTYMWSLSEGTRGASILGRGVICQALAHYHRLTGNARAWKLLEQAMLRARETILTPEGFGTKTSYLRRNYFAPGESDFILEPLGYLWEKTGDESWMRLGLLNFRLALLQRNPISGTNMGAGGGAAEPLRHWPPFLAAAHASGLLRDLELP